MVDLKTSGYVGTGSALQEGCSGHPQLHEVELVILGRWRIEEC